MAVLINKALLELSPRFAGRHPVRPDEDGTDSLKTWRGAQGLAEDVRYYGQWMREEALRTIGHLYPKAQIPKDLGGGEATVVGWIWARTVRCPNPACGAVMPLATNWRLSTKPKRRAWISPEVDIERRSVSFRVRRGSAEIPASPKMAAGANFRCIICSEPAPESHVVAEAAGDRLGLQLLAIVAEGNRGRHFLDPDVVHERAAEEAVPSWRPSGDMPNNPRWFSPPKYGMTSFSQLFTDRQLVTLETFSRLLATVRSQARQAAERTMPNDPLSLANGGSGAEAYADAVTLALSFAVDKLADWGSTICSWIPQIEGVTHTFSRQAISMTWDFTEINPLSSSVGNFMNHVDWTASALESLPLGPLGHARQLDAAQAIADVESPIVSTDPPYYDNIGYADLSDFFYIWLRRSLADIFPNELSTILVPKSQELVATPFRFDGSKALAREHFESGLSGALSLIHEAHNPEYPATVYYAFKQAETRKGDSTVSTGWETMLNATISSGFAITGTWPIRTERAARAVGIGANMLASSVVLVLRPRPLEAPLGSRREFVSALKIKLPIAVRHLQQGSVAPVDLAQAAIGPGMGVYCSFARILEADGSAMTVRTALGLINQVLDETLAEQEGDYDPDTRWTVAWFEQFGVSEAPYGQAETLSKAKNTSVQGLVDAGVLESKAGRVRLLTRNEMSATWDPTTDARLTVWEVTQHLIRSLAEDGEQAAADLLRRVGPGLGETARELSYRLYTICERKKWAGEALAYNSLVVAWPEIRRLASAQATDAPSQGTML